MKVKIYYHHTDCGGVVYYANYLKFLEEARTEYLAERGISVKELSQHGTLFVVARQEIDYKFPAFYGDSLQINTKIGNIGGVRIEFQYEIKNQNGQIISKAKTILVCVDKDLKPKAIPEEVRKLLP
jgi:acyl-CoA thioester hydrolase